MEMQTNKNIHTRTKKPRRAESKFLNLYRIGKLYEKRIIMRKESGVEAIVCEQRLQEHKKKMELVREAIDNVKNDRYKKILFEKCIELKTYDEIAEEIGLKVSTVERYYFRALNKIEIPEEIKCLKI